MQRPGPPARSATNSTPANSDAIVTRKAMVEFKQAVATEEELRQNRPRWPQCRARHNATGADRALELDDWESVARPELTAEPVLNREVSAWRHPDGAVKVDRMRRPPVLQTAPRPSRLCVSYAGPTAARLAAPLGDGTPSFLRAVLLARLRRLLRHRLLSLVRVDRKTPSEPRWAAWRWLARARALAPGGAHESMH